MSIKNPNVDIRPGEQKDATKIIEILKQGRYYTNITLNPSLVKTVYTDQLYFGEYWDNKKVQLLANLKNSKNQYWVLELDAIIVGFSEVIYEPEWIELDQIYILPNYHSKGLGSLLLKHLLNNLKRYDQDLKLEVVEYNNQAINFYNKYGFHKTTTKLAPYIQPDGTEIPAIEMILSQDKLGNFIK